MDVAGASFAGADQAIESCYALLLVYLGWQMPVLCMATYGHV
jgi:hypothetical protein